MESQEFYIKFNEFIRANDKKSAIVMLMTELGKIMIKNREDFVYALQYSGLTNLSNESSDVELINGLIDNVEKNKKLIMAMAFLVATNNKLSSFDGEEYMSNICADAMKKTMYDHFEGKRYSNIYSNFDGDYMNSYASGDANFDRDIDMVDGESMSNVGGDPVSAVADALGKGADLGKVIAGNSKKAMDSKQMDLLAKKVDAKNALVQSVVNQRESEVSAKNAAAASAAKNKKALIIGGISLGVIALAITGVIIYKKMKSK